MESGNFQKAKTFIYQLMSTTATPLRMAIAALNQQGANITAKNLATRVSVPISANKMGKIISGHVNVSPLEACEIHKALKLDDKKYPLRKIFPYLNLTDKDERMLRSQAARRMTALELQKSRHSGRHPEQPNEIRQN